MDGLFPQQAADAGSHAGTKPRAPWVFRYLLAGAVGVLFVLLNWPGEPDQSSFDFGLSFGPIEIRHGWPFVFATRRVRLAPDQCVKSLDELLKLTRLWNVGDAITEGNKVAGTAYVIGSWHLITLPNP